jgi:uncharacterized protein YjbI with pentapeptide repeats
MIDGMSEQTWWERRRRWQRSVIVLVGVVVFILIWWLLPPCLYATTQDPAVRVKAITDTRTALLAGLVGIGAIGTFWMSNRNFRLTERSQKHAIEDAAERRITELYAKAVDQLGSEHAPVRLGGLYALERLAQTTPAQRPIIANVLCAYLRMPFDPEDGGQDTDSGRAARQEREVRLTAQRLLFSHFAAESQAKFWGDISLDLSYAYLIELDLRRLQMPTMNWTRATFAGKSDFTGAIFNGGSSFEGATFTGETSFTEATFSRLAQFRGAIFVDIAQFNGVDFGGASFRKARFTNYANFRLANFTGETAFSEATFNRGADFGEATFKHECSFRETIFATSPQFDGARAVGGVSHVWPSGWKLSDSDGSDGLLTLSPILGTDAPTTSEPPPAARPEGESTQLMGLVIRLRRIALWSPERRAKSAGTRRL